MFLKKISLFLLIMPLISFASQKVTIKPDGEGTIQIAQKALNRIYLEGDKVSQIISLNGELLIQKDLEAGQLFLKPMDEAREKAIEVFLSTEKGYQFSLSLQPVALKAQNIGIQVKENNNDLVDEKRIISFIKEINHYHYPKEGSLSSPFSPPKKQLFYNENLLGEAFKISNSTRKPLFINIQKYWKEGALAVGIKKEILKPGESTEIYIVKKYG